MVDVEALRAAWYDRSLTQAEIARHLGITAGQLTAAVKQHGLPPRPKNKRAFTFADNPTPEEDKLSAASLELSPSVQARIKELKLGLPVVGTP
ncbi:hypothetical protein EBZ39_00435 [bacterium]|nr:hypothetical protein [bacterium]